jgi:hypothetical protein
MKNTHVFDSDTKHYKYRVYPKLFDKQFKK